MLVALAATEQSILGMAYLINKTNLQWPSGCLGLCSRSSPILKIVGISLGTLGSLYAVRSIFGKAREARLRKKWNEAGKDVVVFHQFWNGKLCPQLSPFVAKVEIFMRIHGIKYKRDISTPFGPNNLCPWITLNGQEIPDSQVIMEHLAKHFNLELYPKTMLRERIATLEAARIMMEEYLYWILYLQRYYYDRSKTFVTTQKFPVWYLKYHFLYVMPWQAYFRVKRQGSLLIPQERQQEICRQAFENLDAILGDNKYFGGSEPCSADCSLFGFLMQLVWNSPGTVFEQMLKDYPRLIKYCYTMKEKVYPDWDKVLVPPKA